MLNLNFHETKYHTGIIFLLIVTGTSAQELNTFFKETDSFFKANIVDGRVKYNAIKETSLKHKLTFFYIPVLR